MQSAAEDLRQELWSKLKPVFDKYSKGTDHIKTCEVETVVREVLGHSEINDIEYVVRNMFRLDKDNSGTVDFIEFGNFLFKGHCAEMSLQKRHMANKMCHGENRKMNFQEFFELVNAGLAFLNVKIQRANAQQGFKLTDKDCDGFITYSEYFQYVNQFICKPKKPQPIPPPNPKPEDNNWNSKIKLFIWKWLRKSFDNFAMGRKLEPTDSNLKGLVRIILGQLNRDETFYIMGGLNKLSSNKTIDFDQFAYLFIYRVAQLQLRRFFYNHHSSKMILNIQEFLLILRNAFKFLGFGQVRRNILALYFGLIDKNRDGSITHGEFLDWVQKVLAASVNRKDEFYLKEDDDANKDAKVIDPYTPFIPGKFCKFEFSSYELAKIVRAKVRELLAQFDKNKNEKFEQNEIKDALLILLRQNSKKMEELTCDVFGYDKNRDNIISYDQLTNFCVERHFGELAVQRLQQRNTYERAWERLMNKEEFEITLNDSLGYFGLKATPQQIDTLFREIDFGRQGWITYDIYFLFLMYYFGSMFNQKPYDPHQEWLDEISKLSALDRFVRIFLDQLKKIFGEEDKNKNQLFEQGQIMNIFTHVFDMDQGQAKHYFGIYFNKKSTKDSYGLKFEDLVGVMIKLHFTNINMNTTDKDGNKKLNVGEFIDTILRGARILPYKPPKEDLTVIFAFIDKDKDGFISYQEYFDFIQKYLGKCKKQDEDNQDEDKPDPKPNQDDPKKPDYICEQQWALIQDLWAGAKVQFDKYDCGKKGYLTYSELKRFIIEVLNGTQCDINDIFLNKIEFDPNLNQQIDLREFTQEMVQHAGQMTTQRFQNQRINKYDYSLNLDQFLHLAKNTYPFMQILPKHEIALRKIYSRYLKKNGEFRIDEYADWRENAVARRFTGRRKR